MGVHKLPYPKVVHTIEKGPILGPFFCPQTTSIYGDK